MSEQPRIAWDKPQRITLGLPSKMMGKVMDEWLYRKAPVTMTVRRAKTKGLTAVVMDIKGEANAEGIIFASWCINEANGAAKIDIKPL